MSLDLNIEFQRFEVEKLSKFAVTLVKYLWRVIKWLTTMAWVFWAIVAPWLLILCVWKIWGPTEPFFRWLGGALQLLGFGLAIVNLVGLEKLFSAQGLLGKFKSYFASFPRWPRKITASMSATLGADFSASANATVRRGYTGDIEQRVTALQENLRMVDAELASMRATNKKIYKELRDELEHKSQQLGAELKELQQRVGDAFTGGATLEWLGLYFFIIGITLATTSVEISRELAKLF